MLLYQIAAVICIVLAFVHELKGKPIMAESLAKGMALVSGDKIAADVEFADYVKHLNFHVAGLTVGLTGWIFWQAASTESLETSRALAKIATMMSAETVFIAVSLGLKYPETHGHVAFTSPPIYRSLATLMLGLAGLMSDTRGT